MKSGNTADTSKKQTIRVGVIDIVIIVAVLALIVTAVLRFTSDAGWFNTDSTGCRVAFTVTGVRYTSYDALEAGETVFLENGEKLGTLSEASFTPAVFYATGIDGGLIDAHYPENTLIDISGQFSCELIAANGGYITSRGTHIAAGSTVKVRTRTMDMTVTITSVTVAESGKTE